VSSRDALGLFEGFGIELEYMIVEQDALGVLPAADRLIEQVGGEPVNEVERGALAWSNELALHIIELKTNGPVASLSGVAANFQHDVAEINRRLASLGGRLMPTAMHPLMDPLRDTHLWPHEQGPIYQTFDRIFGCSGHGWSNLQSTHINLPFAGDREFGRLHAAIRLVLPILPALAASSPLVEGRVTGTLDTRLEVYRNNARAIPSVAGAVIPEAVYTRRDYKRSILEAIYRDLAPHDPRGILRYEWVNSRGAIARFDRDAIEIRVLDIQECPRADIALADLIVTAVRAQVDQAWMTLGRQQAFEVAPMHAILLGTLRDAERAVIDNRRYLDAFGYPERGRASAGELWQHLIEVLLKPDHGAADGWPEVIRTWLDHGPLARRILTALGDGQPAPDQIRAVYASLCDCLAEDRLFVRPPA